MYGSSEFDASPMWLEKNSPSWPAQRRRSWHKSLPSPHRMSRRRKSAGLACLVERCFVYVCVLAIFFVYLCYAFACNGYSLVENCPLGRASCFLKRSPNIKTVGCGCGCLLFVDVCCRCCCCCCCRCCCRCCSLLFVVVCCCLLLCVVVCCRCRCRCCRCRGCCCCCCCGRRRGAGAGGGAGSDAGSAARVWADGAGGERTFSAWRSRRECWRLLEADEYIVRTCSNKTSKILKKASMPLTWFLSLSVRIVKGQMCFWRMF